MPSRPATLVIVLFWAATAGWFIHREVWPQLAATGPAPFTIEITDEAVRQLVPVRWTLYRNGERLTSVRTSVEYREPDDSFSLNATVGPMVVAGVPGMEIKLRVLTSQYRVTRAGQLLDAQTEIAFDAAGIAVRVVITADMQGELMTPRCRVEFPGVVLEPPLDPLPATRSGVLNPLHPVHRIAGLRPGRRWIVPLDDPLADAVRAAVEGLFRQQLGKAAPKLPKTGPRQLAAVVTGPWAMTYAGARVDCYVIEYRGDDYTAETWVRVSDGTVLKQEATGIGETLTLLRD